VLGATVPLHIRGEEIYKESENEALLGSRGSDSGEGRVVKRRSEHLPNLSEIMSIGKQ